jgi:hypothetical protein
LSANKINIKQPAEEIKRVFEELSMNVPVCGINFLIGTTFLSLYGELDTKRQNTCNKSGAGPEQTSYHKEE